MNAWQSRMDPVAHARWVVASVVLSVLAMVGLVVAVPDVDAHPVMFTCSVTWVVGGFTGLFAQRWLLGLDPWRLRLARWEREGRVYRWVGVEGFRWLLRHTPLGWLNPALRLTGRERPDIESLLRQMNFAEGAHLIGGVITLGLAVGYAVTGHGRVALCFGGITLVVHFYPLITQRWNRGRVARVVQRAARRAASLAEKDCRDLCAVPSRKT